MDSTKQIKPDWLIDWLTDGELPSSQRAAGRTVHWWGCLSCMLQKWPERNILFVKKADALQTNYNFCVDKIHWSWLIVFIGRFSQKCTHRFCGSWLQNLIAVSSSCVTVHGVSDYFFVQHISKQTQLYHTGSLLWRTFDPWVHSHENLCLRTQRYRYDKKRETKKQNMEKNLQTSQNSKLKDLKWYIAPQWL